jgi:hypothetical protein
LRRHREHTGILGPVLRAEVGDTIRVVFKNNAGREYSVHAHGVFYRKDSEGAPGNDGTLEADKRDDAVTPGDTWTYIWSVSERAGPGPRDPNSIVWHYHSHTDRVRDTNAGLIGAMIITRKGETAASGRPKSIDREFITLWKIFDENKSWYVEDDTKRAGGNYAQLRKDDDFKESNKKHAVNGSIFGNVPMMSMRVPALQIDLDRARAAGWLPASPRAHLSVLASGRRFFVDFDGGERQRGDRAGL